MNIRSIGLIFITLIMSPAAIGMNHEKKALYRALRIIQHLYNAPLALPLSQSGNYVLTDDSIIGKHKHLFSSFMPYFAPK